MADTSADTRTPGELRLDRLLGREVFAGNNRRVGRLQEFRAQQRGTEWIVTGYVIGAAGLLERLGVGARLLFGRTTRTGYRASWNQIDISQPERPRLTCPLSELERI